MHVVAFVESKGGVHAHISHVAHGLEGFGTRFSVGDSCGPAIIEPAHVFLRELAKV